MSYYLPIMINGRRMEFLKLLGQGEESDPISTKRFVIVNQNSPTILSIENSNRATLISSKGIKNNVDLGRLNYVISKDEIPTNDRVLNNPIVQKYTITLQEETKSENSNGKDPLVVTDGDILKRDGYNHSVVQWDSTIGRGNYELELVICYGEYKCSIIVYLCREVTTVAMDFGSEATQVRRNTDRHGNMNLLKEYRKFLGDSQSDKSSKNDKGGKEAKAVMGTQERRNPDRKGSMNMTKCNESSEKGSLLVDLPTDDKEFYQYDPNGGLFKSIIYLNVHPTQIKYGEKPQVDNSQMYVLPLMYPNLYTKIEQSRYLLPNLKLLDLYGDLLSGTSLGVDRTQCDISPAGSYSLGDAGIYAGTLRIVISQFLHCIFNSFEVDCYLRLVFLAPNVYRQKKLADIMLGIYADFDIIKKNNLYPHVKGLEVQFLSESDASFLGWVVQHPGEQTFPNGCILAIDAGKGTTDFSVIKQNGKSLTNYTSLYRDGIPASGNYITYAFYEALSEISNERGWKLNERLDSAVKNNPSEAKRFVSYLDEFKFNYANTNRNKGFGSWTIKNPTELKNINDVIENYFRDCGQTDKSPYIENAESFVNTAINELVKKIHESLKKYTKSEQKVEFKRLVLSGRAFLFKPLRNRLVDVLIENKLIQKEEHVLFSESGDSSKTECLEGALKMMDMFDVNLNSGMIGSPILEKPSSEDSQANTFPRSRLLKVINHKNHKNKAVAVSKDFYYCGMRINEDHQKIRIGRNVMIPNGTDSFKNSMLFFVGDDYLVQTHESCSCFEDDNGRKTLDIFGKKSLFPFVKESILRDIITPETNAESADAQNGEQVQASNLSPKGGKKCEETSGAGTMD